MDNSGFQKIKEIDFTENSARPPGIMRPRMFRQAMIKDMDNNIYAVYGDRLKKGKATDGVPWQAMELEQDGSGYSFRVYPGTINNILPSNSFASDGGLVKFSISAGQKHYLFLDVATDGTKVTLATLKVESNLPTNAAPVSEGIAPAKIVIPLGVIQDKSALALRSSSLTASPVVAGSRSIAPASPNDEPFIRLWMWKVEGK